MVHGAPDGWPGWYLDRFGDYLLSQSEEPITPEQSAFAERFLRKSGSSTVKGIYHKILDRNVRGSKVEEACPELVAGRPAPEEFPVKENDVTYLCSFLAGYSVGIFLDQRENRDRLLKGRVRSGFDLNSFASLEVLNTFAYTCAFSVCAARAGARVTSLDLSKKYLDWGRRNFEANGMDPEEHDFIYGDTFDWMKRLQKKGRGFDAIILDPPTFSKSKESGVFRASKDYGKLVAAAMGILNPEGVLLASCNTAGLTSRRFRAMIGEGISSARRRIITEFEAPQALDFPSNEAEPEYLKVWWLGVE